MHIEAVFCTICGHVNVAENRTSIPGGLQSPDSSQQKIYQLFLDPKVSSPSSITTSLEISSDVVSDLKHPIHNISVLRPLPSTCVSSTSANSSVVTTSGATFDNIVPKNTVRARPAA
ncbi:hypothetical protein BcDW1_5732 [Botrytis cinerea BcDW1]|uniref:Uncharacterized protein n=1 Tax=Botryotinia fuckeliana (strain BcDW1) TaxID=1290391 RepID=M7TQ29_BOTF1|nr:hypothetical protein BcDW1_5732 [Botrytis cinerea BcDW1]